MGMEAAVVTIDQSTLIMVLGGCFSVVLIPWAVWVTAAIFYMRQEVSVMKAIFNLLKSDMDERRRS